MGDVSDKLRVLQETREGRRKEVQWVDIYPCFSARPDPNCWETMMRWFLANRLSPVAEDIVRSGDGQTISSAKITLAPSLPSDVRPLSRSETDRVEGQWADACTLHPQVILSQAVNFMYFNMEDPLVGGYTPDKVALRRAIGLGMDVEREIRIMRGGQAVVAHSPIAANLTGYAPAMRSENGEYSPTKAKALLDVFGYVDRNGDGWRERPDGTPLILEMASETDGNSRQYDELMQRNMKEIGLRIRFKVAQWPENAKAARAGKLMMWAQGYGSTAPDGLAAIERLYGPAAGGANLSRFRLPAMDALYDRLLALPDGPERLQAFHEAKQLAVAYMPEKTTVHRVFSHMTRPWLVGYRPPLFGGRWFHLVDIESGRR